MNGFEITSASELRALDLAFMEKGSEFPMSEQRAWSLSHGAGVMMNAATARSRDGRIYQLLQHFSKDDQPKLFAMELPADFFSPEELADMVPIRVRITEVD